MERYEALSLYISSAIERHIWSCFKRSCLPLDRRYGAIDKISSIVGVETRRVFKLHAAIEVPNNLKHAHDDSSNCFYAVKIRCKDFQNFFALNYTLHVY